MHYDIVATEAPTAADRNAVLALLVAYNDSQAGPHSYQPLALLLRDAGGATTGGLLGRLVYDWLYVELLGVPEPLRRQGLGTQLMRRAEAIARERGCVGVWVDTYGFQARGFYEKLGYEIFGTIDDHPRGSHRFFFRKRL
jgi:GNAT superfamily N-acetyltransferase